jgi:hypothetical protein
MDATVLCRTVAPNMKICVLTLKVMLRNLQLLMSVGTIVSTFCLEVDRVFIWRLVYTLT